MKKHFFLLCPLTKITIRVQENISIQERQCMPLAKKKKNLHVLFPSDRAASPKLFHKSPRHHLAGKTGNKNGCTCTLSPLLKVHCYKKEPLSKNNNWMRLSFCPPYIFNPFIHKNNFHYWTSHSILWR